ncbi:unnamed protein product [Ectocarpus sp. 6 AP-2014]
MSRGDSQGERSFIYDPPGGDMIQDNGETAAQLLRAQNSAARKPTVAEKAAEDARLANQRGLWSTGGLPRGGVAQYPTSHATQGASDTAAVGHEG